MTPTRRLTIEELRAWSGPPLIVFLGISTAGSLVHEVFPAWAPIFAPGCVLVSVDLPPDAPAAEFRNVVSVMQRHPHVRGGVVTSHKLRLFQACQDMCDSQDLLVRLTHEINALDTRDGVHAFARDPQSLDIVLAELLGASAARPATCIGAGGSAIALLLASLLDVAASLRADAPILRAQPGPVADLTIIGLDQAALDGVDAVRERCAAPAGAVRLVASADADSTTAIVDSAPPGSVVVNATGLGKTDDRSPLLDSATFPAGALAWDFNYRGPLPFLAQAKASHATIEDGWAYFVAGWSAATECVSTRGGCSPASGTHVNAGRVVTRPR